MSEIRKNEAAEASGDLSSSRTLGAWTLKWAAFSKCHLGTSFTDTQFIHKGLPRFGTFKFRCPQVLTFMQEGQ